MISSNCGTFRMKPKLFQSSGILRVLPNYLEVCFVGGMPPEFYNRYKFAFEFEGTLNRLRNDRDYRSSKTGKNYVFEYLEVYWKQGYFEALSLPYEYDLEKKCLTVLNFPAIAQEYGFYAAEVIKDHDIPF
jgi:hypothetical protein